jgi:hypothetical protein
MVSPAPAAPGPVTDEADAVLSSSRPHSNSRRLILANAAHAYPLRSARPWLRGTITLPPTIQ